ncbi:GP5 [Guinea pig adenovirus]|nr:GP5 [Guinea pig adenovirus]
MGSSGEPVRSNRGERDRRRRTGEADAVTRLRRAAKSSTELLISAARRIPISTLVILGRAPNRENGSKAVAPGGEDVRVAPLLRRLAAEDDATGRETAEAEGDPDRDMTLEGGKDTLAGSTPRRDSREDAGETEAEEDVEDGVL